MGRERNRAGQFLLLCAAGLITTVFTGCASIRTIREERAGRIHLQHERLLTRQGDFAGAARDNQAILDKGPEGHLADAALYSMGLIHAAPANPGKDYRKSLDCFRRLVRDFPRSPYAADAAIWTGVLENEVSAEREGRAHLNRIQDLIRKGDFAGAEREDREALGSARRDAALFSLGQIFADPANPGRNDKAALGFFTQVGSEFPQGPFAGEARLWAGILGPGVVRQEADAHLQRIGAFARDGDFEGAVRENRKLLSQPGATVPLDAVLFSQGLVFSDPANPGRDYAKAQESLERLSRECPGSSYTPQARVLEALLRSKAADRSDWRTVLPQSEGAIDRGDFQGALREDARLLRQFPKTPPGDAALFQMGMIHVYYANPRMDFKAALDAFTQLRNDFPRSPFLEAAQTWISILKRMEAASRVDIEIYQKKKELRK